MEKTKKEKLKIIIGSAVIVVCILSAVAVYVNHSNDNTDTIDLTTVTQKLPTLSVDEKEYSFVGKDNKTYYVKHDGMYCEGEDGLMKIEPFVNISPFNKYQFSYDNGTVCTIDLKKDGNFEMITTYPNGDYLVNRGVAQIANGFDNVLKVLGVKKVSELEDIFQTPSEVINPNNLYHIVLPCDESINYDKDGKEIVFEETEDHGEELLNKEDKYVAQDLVLLLDHSDNLKLDSSGKQYYDVSCVGYSKMYNLMYADWSVNGAITVDLPLYVESEE